MTNLDPKSSQFRLNTLLASVTCMAVFCAAASWIIQSEAFELWRFPFLFMPSIPMMIVGIIGSMVFCVAALIASVTFFVRARPRPIASLLFFGCVTLVFVVDESAQLRLLLVMSASAIVVLAETLVRGLPKSQVVAALLAIAASCGYYFLYVVRASLGGRMIRTVTHRAPGTLHGDGMPLACGSWNRDDKPESVPVAL